MPCHCNDRCNIVDIGDPNDADNDGADCKYSVWIGGSILASLSTFQLLSLLHCD
jgi:actin-related protein